VPRYKEVKRSYQWRAWYATNDKVTGNGGITLGTSFDLPPLEGKVVRWVGHLTAYNMEPTAGNVYNATLLASIQAKQMDDADWEAYFGAYSQDPSWDVANQAPDDYPVCLPISIAPQQYISMPFDMRGKRRWHRGDVVRFGLHHSQPGSSDVGLAVGFNARCLLQFD